MRYLFLMRVHHWVKNLFIYIPAFFAGTVFQFEKFLLLTEGFFCFSLASSAVYILNDYLDMSSDLLHPVKKNRPLASGKISVTLAKVLMGSVLLCSLVWAYTVNHEFFFMVLLYVTINVGYSFGLKDIPLLDIFLISLGFLIRTLSGGIIVSVPVSQWLVIMIFLLSLLLAFAKREQDLILANGSVTIRKSSRQYSVEYIHICLSLIAGVIMVAYIMYTMSDEVRQRVGENYLYITSIFVFAGILRYLQITLVKHNGGSPTRIFLTDRFIQGTILGWVLTFFVTLYL